MGPGMLKAECRIAHPFEIAFCGLSGSGKTTLIKGVIRHFRQMGHEPGYFKHGCHRFDIDREGKDSFLAREAGAVSVMIADPGKQALICDGSGSIPPGPAFRSCDMLFIEGLKELPTPKLLFVDARQTLLSMMQAETIRNVMALVHEGSSTGLDRFGLPVFHRDDLAGITAFIEGFFEKRAAEVPLYGLVLAGGRSSRMGTDKAMLNYRPESQLTATVSLLSGTCGKVFVSCRREQAEKYAGYGVPLITDTYLDMGPMGGLLSAQRSHSEAAWFVAACDFPFMDGGTVASLAGNRDPFRFATAFCGPGDPRPEPLFTIYEPKSRQQLLQRHGEGDDSLSSFLRQTRIVSVDPEDPNALHNVNDPAAMKLALQAIQRGNGPC